MKKKIGSICLGILVYYWGSMFASINDCGIVNNVDIQNTTGYKQILNTVQQQNFTSILPTEALQKALENLKKFCCQSSSIEDENCKGYKEKQGYPSSPFLYDHLIDIQLRRLDAIPKLIYGLDGDAIGSQWRKFITETTTAKVSVQADNIVQTYKKYRTTKNTIHEYSTPEDIKIFLQSYTSSQTTLIDKYLSTCDIMARIYNSIANEKIAIGNSQNSKSAYSKCQNIVQERIHEEYITTKSIINKTANETMHETYKTYTMKYFVQEKIMGLIDLISQIKSLFSTMVHQAAAAKTCNK